MADVYHLKYFKHRFQELRVQRATMREFRNWYRQARVASHETYALLPNTDNVYQSFRTFYSAHIQIYNSEEELLGREYHQVKDRLVASWVMYCLQDVVPDILTSIVHAGSADMFWRS